MTGKRLPAALRGLPPTTDPAAIAKRWIAGTGTNDVGAREPRDATSAVERASPAWASTKRPLCALAFGAPPVCAFGAEATCRSGAGAAGRSMSGS